MLPLFWAIVRKWPLFEKSGAKTLLWAGGVETARAQSKQSFLLLFVHKK
jgi:hypothetical protein